MEKIYWLDYDSSISNIRLFELDPEDEEPYIVVKSGGPDDEGYSYKYVEYYIDWRENEPFAIVKKVTVNACDCDGRIDHYYDYYCPIDELKAYIHPHNGFPMPAWETVSSHQRDYEAEKAGY